MTFRGPEKMDEGPETKDQFVVPSPPSRDSKTSFVGAIRSKHGHQTTSTPYVGAFQASGCANLKRSYDSGTDPTLNWDTPICKAHHAMKYCGHQSFDTLSDVEAHVDEPHPQLNLLPCFEEREEEFPTMQEETDRGNLSIWRDRHSTQKRRSLQMDKSPSPYRNKRHSLDLSSDSGCFSTQTTGSDSHFSSELPHPPFSSPVMQETGKSTFPGLVCSTEVESARSLPSQLAQSYSEKYFASGLQSVLSRDTGRNVNLSHQSSDSFHSNLTPSVGEKVSKLQLVFTGDSGFSVGSMEASGESARNVRSNATPSFGEKLFKLQPVLPSDSKDTSDQSAKDIHLTSTLSFNEKVSKLQFGHSKHSVNTTYLSGSSGSMQPFGDIFSSQSTVTCDSMDISHQSDLFLAKAALPQQDFLTSVEKTSLEITHESEVGCDIPQAMKRSRTQTFEERLALRKMKLDQEIGLRIGKKYVDVIRELSRKLFTEALGKVFSYVSEEDLCSLCLVSRQWKNAVELETNARLRRRKYIQENRQRIAETPQENRSKLMNPTRQQIFTNPNKPMAEIQTTEELAPARPVVPTLTKAEEFREEARSLERTESLRKCPKCDSPARANEKDRRARCTKCRYEFCVFCRMLLHGGTDCVTFVRHPAPAKIGSKQSKQNLRRL